MPGAVAELGARSAGGIARASRSGHPVWDEGQRLLLRFAPREPRPRNAGVLILVSLASWPSSLVVAESRVVLVVVGVRKFRS